MNQKASVYDVIPIIMMMFGMAFAAVIVVTMMNLVNTDFAADTTISPVAQHIMATGASQAPGTFDLIFVMLFVGLPMISAVFAYFNNIHPLFFWASLGIVLLIVMVGAGLAQLWADINTDTLLASQAALMPMMNFILSHYGLYSFFVFVIIAAGSFVKLRGGNSTYGTF